MEAAQICSAGAEYLRSIPAPNSASTLYGAREGEDFYTDTKGEQQPLEQRKPLDLGIQTRDMRSRCDPNGKIVWSYVNRWTNGSVGKISQATRYPDDYLTQFPKESCHG